MYIRFVTPRLVREARGVPAGVFRSGMNGAPDWLRAAIRDEYRWFNDNLRVPNRLGIVTRKSNRRYGGVCWFRDDARDCITHAYALSALLNEAGVPVTRIKSDAPGDIVYRDPQQIVAMPRKEGPRRYIN
ncbi:MAG: hypothetical protein DHS20C05_24460 [Hyphococcus sp.]|nr:MAG: hypothetical protein DHS20C05_24460 [Marinicaulis sp.]